MCVCVTEQLRRSRGDGRCSTVLLLRGVPEVPLARPADALANRWPGLLLPRQPPLRER